jgi:hypothetical protein
LERAQVRRFPGLGARNLGGVADHKPGLVLEETPQRLAGVALSHKALNACVTGRAAAAHVEGNLRQAQGASRRNRRADFSGLVGWSGIIE